MKSFWSPNLQPAGRRARAGIGALLLAGAAVAFFVSPWWVGTLLLVGAAFVLFEAARGWCLLRACGLKTKL